MRQLDDLLPGGVGQRPTVHVDAAELIDAAVAGGRAAEQRRLADRGGVAVHNPLGEVERV